MNIQYFAIVTIIFKYKLEKDKNQVNGNSIFQSELSLIYHKFYTCINGMEMCLKFL